MIDRRTQLICARSCYVFLVLFGVGWVALAGFVPPPSPLDSADSIARQFRDNATAIRVGMVICVMSSALLLPWGGAVCTQLRRIEGRHSALAWAWIAANACIVIEFIYPCVFWAVAAFRLDDPARVQAFNDLAWLPYLSVVSTGMFQMAVIGYLTLIDKRPEPVFPRWFGYFQIWCLLGVSPAEFVLVFKTGPLAWNGILAFWVAVIAAFGWILVTTVMTVRAIKRQPPDTDFMLGDDALSARVARLETRLDELEGNTHDVIHPAPASTRQGALR